MPVALKRSLGLRSPVSIRQVRDVGGLTDFLAARPDGDKLTEHIDDAATYYAPGVIKDDEDLRMPFHRWSWKVFTEDFPMKSWIVATSQAGESVDCLMGMSHILNCYVRNPISWS